jgi:RNA polymerase sigma-70 factor (ECF subfamily)
MHPSLRAGETSPVRAADAFERAAAPLLKSLEAYCRSVARNRWDADDLLQDTLEKAFARFARTGGAILTKAYLCRIASNAWIDRLRRARESVRPAEWAGWETLARAGADAGDETRAAVERLLALTPKQRTALLLCEAFGLPLQETADRLGLTVGSVKALLHRARARLGREGDGAEAAGPDAAAVDAYVEALRRGSADAVVALGAAVEAGAEASRAAPGAPALRGAPLGGGARPHGGARSAPRAALRAGRQAGYAAGRTASVRRTASAGGRLVGFAATASGACAAVALPGAPARVLSFRAGDAVAV